MSNVYAIAELNKIDLDRASDTEYVREANKIYEMVKRTIHSKVLSVNGGVLGDIEGRIIVEVPNEAAEVLKEVKNILSKDLNVKITIGVGETIPHAKKALEFALEHKNGGIKVYTPEVIEHQEKEEESEKRPAVGPDDIKSEITKSENQEDIKPEDKQKIAGLLDKIRENKDHMDQLKETNPEVYEATVGVVQSLADMLSKEKTDKRNQSLQVIDDIKEYFDNKEESRKEEETDYIEHNLMSAISEFQREKDQKREEMFRNYKLKYKNRLSDAKRHTRQHGGNPHFFAKLHRKMEMGKKKEAK